MSDQLPVGRITFGSPPTPEDRARHVLASLASKPMGGSRAWDEAITGFGAAIQNAMVEQFAVDCATLCDACKRGVAAERVIGGIWSHRAPPHYNTVTCAAHPLRAAWAEREKGSR